MESQEFIKHQSPANYLKIFFRRKWLFVAPVFVGFVLSVAFCFLLPPMYESSSVILVEEEKIINPLIQGLAVSTAVADRMRTLREQILSWDSLVELTKQLNLTKDIETQKQFEGLIARLRRNIIVQMRGPNIIKITYFGESPEQTQLVAKTLNHIFIDKNLRSQTKETDVAIDFIKDQLQVYKRKIKESEVAKMEEELKNLLLDSTEQHPLVKELRQKISLAKNELESGDYKVSETEEPITNPTYKVLEQELDKLTSKESATGLGSSVAFAANNNGNDDPNAAIYKLILMDKLDSVLARDMRVNENIYNMLLQKLETAKITQRLETSKEGTRYTVIDPPRLPLKPAKPNKAMVVFLGIFLGSFSGTGLVLGREFLDQSFLDIDDAKKNLELPILGAISRLVTQEEIDKEKYRKKRFLVIASVSAFMLLLYAMFVALFRK